MEHRSTLAAAALAFAVTIVFIILGSFLTSGNAVLTVGLAVGAVGLLGVHTLVTLQELTKRLAQVERLLRERRSTPART
jgi:hypothetical protein